ncbi:MAG: PAS domain S-box protein [Candidatus Thiodiazotropha sp.]
MFRKIVIIRIVNIRSVLAMLHCLIPIVCFAEGPPVRSAGELSFPPFSIEKKDGSADGFSVELMREALKAMGREVSFVAKPWEEIKNDLIAGKLDALPIVGRTPEREKEFDFTVPYITLYGAVFTRKDTQGIERLEDLRDRRIGVMRGNNAEDFMIRQGLTDQLITTTTIKDALLMLSRGTLDAVVAQRLVGINLINKLKLENLETAIAPLRAFSQEFCFAVSEGNKTLLADLNEGLSVIVANGTYEVLYDKWLSSYIDKHEKILHYLKITSALAILLFLILLTIYQRMHLKGHRQLKASEKRYRTLFENMTQGALYLNRHGKLIACNQATLNLFGLSYDQLAIETSQANPWKLINEDGTDFSSDQHPSIQALQTGEPVHNIIAGIYNQKKGKQVWLSINAIPLFNSDLWKPNQIFVILHEITEIRKAKEDLKIERQRLQHILEGTRAGTWEWNLTTGETIFNNRWAEIIGYTLDEISPVSIETWLHFCHPRDLEESNRLIQKHLAGELDYYQVELRMRHKNGDWVWVLDRGKVVSYAKDGTPVWMAGTHTDVTQRKQAEESLRESIAINQTMLRSIPDLVWLKDPHGVYLSCNPAFEGFIGLSEDEIIGKRDADLPTGDLSGFTSTCDQVNLRLGEACTKEQWVPFADSGKTLLMLTTKTPTYDQTGKIIGVLGIARDITKQYHTQEEVREKESYQRALLDNFPFKVWLKDTQSRFLAVNQPFALYAGYSDANDLRGKSDFDIWPNDLAEAYRRDDLEVMDNQLKKEIIEESVDTSGRKWVETYKAPVLGNNNELFGTVGFSHDISSIKQAEEIRVLNLEKQRDELIQEIHHRIKNHLQGLISLLDHRKNYGKNNTDPIGEVITQIESIATVYGLQTERLSGQIILHQMLDAIVFSISGISQVPLAVSYQDEYSEIRIDRDKAVAISLVINELIMNAVKHSRYTKNGKISISCDRQPEHIAINIVNPGVLPNDFDLQSNQGLGTGLSLALAMLPIRGARISISCQDNEVFTELIISSPLITDGIT